MNIDPTTSPTRASVPPVPWSMKASKSASLAMNPNSSGMPAIDPAATAATASTPPQPGPGRGSRRTSRVPRWWSTIPATMKAAALKAPWASSITQPAVSAAGVPQPNTAIISPSWLIVP